jgi:hypothetical protein
MTTIITINHPDKDHLETVIAEMRALGAPAIRAIADEFNNVIVALEGSHRIAAAKALGLVPVLKMLADDDMLSCDEIGYDDNGWFEGGPARAADIRDRIAEPMGMYSGCNFVSFDSVETA